MFVRFRLRLALVHVALAFCASSLAQSSDPLPIHGIFEDYFESDPTHRGVAAELTYLQLTAQPSKSWKLVASYAQEPGDRWLDEIYAQVQGNRDILRLGRIRSDFGFSNWSDLYYTPIIMVPLIRSYGVEVVPGISLYRLDRGAEYETWSGNLQLQVSAVDSKNDDWHVIPGTMDTGVARFQLSQGPVILGFSGFAKAGDNFGPAQQIAGVDLSFTAPRTQIRGEAITGFGSQAARGFYVDLFYRPPGLARTQLGARVQEIRTAGTSAYGGTYETGGWGPRWSPPPTHQIGQVYTLAARQFLTKNLTLSVNYGAGNNIPLTRPLLGWSSQLQFSYRF